MVEEKPKYKILSMAEIGKIKKNGYNVISTFSGCGGSSLGYKMAGYKVLWANEFIPAAQEVYKLNHKDTILNCCDIRELTAKKILSEINKKAGEIDILDGSPPCASFSTAGKREKTWGKVKKYSETNQVVDDLFFEYIRLLKGIKPKIFIAENVSGLVKGKAKGYFLEILKEMKNSGYNVKAKVLDAQWLGVPQSRQRLIFIGVRNDLKLEPIFPKPLGYRYSVKNALPNIGKLRMKSPSSGNNYNNNDNSVTDISKYAIGNEYDKLKEGEQSKKYFNLVKVDRNKPAPTVCQSHGQVSTAGICHPVEKRKFTIEELKRISSFPEDFILVGSYVQQWERIGRAVPPIMMYYIAKSVQEDILDKI